MVGLPRRSKGKTRMLPACLEVILQIEGKRSKDQAQILDIGLHDGSASLISIGGSRQILIHDTAIRCQTCQNTAKSRVVKREPARRRKVRKDEKRRPWPKVREVGHKNGRLLALILKDTHHGVLFAEATYLFTSSYRTLSGVLSFESIRGVVSRNQSD